MKRGNTWSYVIRVKDPETGVSKPRWVGGFRTEEARLGHTDPAITLRVYAHVIRTAEAAAADIFAQAVKAA